MAYLVHSEWRPIALQLSCWGRGLVCGKPVSEYIGGTPMMVLSPQSVAQVTPGQGGKEWMVETSRSLWCSLWYMWYGDSQNGWLNTAFAEKRVWPPGMKPVRFLFVQKLVPVAQNSRSSRMSTGMSGWCLVNGCPNPYTSRLFTSRK